MSDDFPNVHMHLLTDREQLILQLHYADGWSLRRVARGVGVHHYAVQKQHNRALQVLHSHGAYCLGHAGSHTTPTFIEDHEQEAG